VFQLYSFDSGYSLVVLGEGGVGVREEEILVVRPNIAFWFFLLPSNEFAL
jgi:hypothetical protein